MVFLIFVYQMQQKTTQVFFCDLQSAVFMKLADIVQSC